MTYVVYSYKIGRGPGDKKVERGRFASLTDAEKYLKSRHRAYKKLSGHYGSFDSQSFTIVEMPHSTSFKAPTAAN